MSQDGYRKGVLGMMSSSVLFTCMSVLVRSSGDVSPFIAAFYRFAIGATLLGTLALFRKIRLEFHNILLLVLRGVCGGVAVLLFYLSITKIGLAKATVISFTYPLFATLFGAMFLGERIRPLSAAFVATCTAGLVLANYDSAVRSIVVDMWTLLAFVGAILAGVAVVAIRGLSKTDSPYSIYLSQCLFGFWIVLIPANSVQSDVGLVGALIVLGIGLVASAGQLIMTWAFRHVDTSTGSLLGMMTVVFNVAIGAIVFAELRGLPSFFGMVVIIVSCAGIVYSNRPRLAAIEINPLAGVI